MSHDYHVLGGLLAFGLLVATIVIGVVACCQNSSTPITGTAQAPKEFSRPFKTPHDVCLNGVVYYEFDGPTVTYAPKYVRPYAGASVPVTQACE